MSRASKPVPPLRLAHLFSQSPANFVVTINSFENLRSTVYAGADRRFCNVVPLKLAHFSLQFCKRAFWPFLRLAVVCIPQRTNKTIDYRRSPFTSRNEGRDSRG